MELVRESSRVAFCCRRSSCTGLPLICWPRSHQQLNRSVRPQGPLQEMTTNANAMLTFERAPKSRTPKSSFS
jgi:hypothetical protein